MRSLGNFWHPEAFIAFIDAEDFALGWDLDV